MTNVLLEMPWRRLIKVGKPYWVSNQARSAFARLAFILTLLGAKTAVAVFVNRTTGHFMTAIEQKDLTGFYLFFVLSVLAVLVTSPIETTYARNRTKLALLWRQWLSRTLIDKYFLENAGLRIERLLTAEVSEQEKIDNPEQRMTQDVDSFCNSSLGLFVAIMDSVITVLTFITVLWVISPSLTVTVLCYATLGLVIVSYIGKDMVDFSSQQVKTEADLRKELAGAREDLVKTGGSHERWLAVEADNRLNAVISTLTKIMNVNVRIQLFTTVLRGMVPLIPALIIAPSYFAGEIPFGTITQAVMAFTSVFTGASVLIDQFNGLSSFAAITNRLGVLVEALEAGAAAVVETH